MDNCYISLEPTTICVTFYNNKVYYSYIPTSTVWNTQVLSKNYLNVQQCNVHLMWKYQPKTDVTMPDRVDCSIVLWYPNHSNSMTATTRTHLSSQYILQRETSLTLIRSQDTCKYFFSPQQRIVKVCSDVLEKCTAFVFRVTERSSGERWSNWVEWMCQLDGKGGGSFGESN
jgi:hypothetical protein